MNDHGDRSHVVPLRAEDFSEPGKASGYTHIITLALAAVSSALGGICWSQLSDIKAAQVEYAKEQLISAKEVASLKGRADDLTSKVFAIDGLDALQTTRIDKIAAASAGLDARTSSNTARIDELDRRSQSPPARR